MLSPNTLPNSPQSPELVTPQDQLIADKYNICWGIAVDKFAGNVHAMSSLLYQSLYNPGFYKTHEAEFTSEKFPDRITTLSDQIETPEEIPTEEEFTDLITQKLRHDFDYSEFNYPEAIDQIKELTDKGRVIIWTAGDTTGVDQYPGSMIQHSKAVDAGLNKLRTEVKQQTGRKRTDVLSVMAAEDKISDEAIDRMAEAAGDELPIVIDDRLKNLLAVQKKLPNAVLIWMQQDKHGQKIPSILGDVNPDQIAQQYNAVSGIGDLNHRVNELLQMYPETKPVFFVDYDGVLSNDTEKAKRQEQVVLQTLHSHQLV